MDSSAPLSPIARNLTHRNNGTCSALGWSFVGFEISYSALKKPLKLRGSCQATAFYAAPHILCGSITNFLGTPASNSPYPSGA